MLEFGIMFLLIGCILVFLKVDVRFLGDMVFIIYGLVVS